MLALGLDIGGANLKAASSVKEAKTTPFEIWRAPRELTPRLRELIEGFPKPDVLAATMTAELADCFAVKAEGVAAIVAAVCDAAGGTPVIFWQAAGRFAPPEVAAAQPKSVAAANWHALATWAGRLAPRGKALLFDIGTTTTDIIPLHDGRPVARGSTDLERLLDHELVYTGFRRTPLCAVASQVVVRGRLCPVAAEFFATTLDVYLLLGLAAENAADMNTADGRPATIACAHDRLARMVCCDREEIDLAEARAIARCFALAQQLQLSAAITEVVSRDAARLGTVILAGSGALLAGKILAEHPHAQGATTIRLADSLSAELAEAACAYAIAVLATEHQPFGE
jgi:hypothetical protein